ncbi:hypothetical protein H311_02038 [Anncaliia algerae PRA109]|nr:hypothetical protein H311_02038 [Anncaliia algerae PRA109]
MHFYASNSILRRYIGCFSGESLVKLLNSSTSQTCLKRSKSINYKCKNKKSILGNSMFDGTNTPPIKILRIVYSSIFEYSNVQAINFCQISKPSYIKI